MIRRLYLASASPRRYALLQQAGYSFELLSTSVDEESLTAQFDGPVSQLAEYLAAHKARAAADCLLESHGDGVILTADTTVLIDGRSLAKPTDSEEASAMLDSLRGVQHTVATGVAVADTKSNILFLSTSRTLVTMRPYTDQEVQAYVASGDPLDKAGAYSIQHPYFHPVEATRGCYTGVIGLPLCLVSTMLRMVGVVPSSDDRSPEISEAGCEWHPACSQPFPSEVRQYRLIGSHGHTPA